MLNNSVRCAAENTAHSQTVLVIDRNFYDKQSCFPAGFADKALHMIKPSFFYNSKQP
jgi:hypothetical protein